jgi:hypothetical protein
MTPPALHEADAALAQGHWEEAREHYRHILATSEDDAHALEGLSWASWWLSDETATFETRERAYRAYREAGDLHGAARMALWLASDHLDFRGEVARATGWLERAARLIENEPLCVEHGWITLLQTDASGSTPAEYAENGRAAARLGHELDNPDLEAVGLAYEGSGLIARGQVDEGIRRLDEAAAVAAGERFELALAPGWALCTVITAPASAAPRTASCSPPRASGCAPRRSCRRPSRTWPPPAPAWPRAATCGWASCVRARVMRPRPRGSSSRPAGIRSPRSARPGSTSTPTTPPARATPPTASCAACRPAT